MIYFLIFESKVAPIEPATTPDTVRVVVETKNGEDVRDVVNEATNRVASYVKKPEDWRLGEIQSRVRKPAQQ